MRNRYAVFRTKARDDKDWRAVLPDDPLLDVVFVREAARLLRDCDMLHEVTFRTSEGLVRVAAVDSFHIDFPPKEKT